MRLLTSKDGDLSSYFDKNGESVINDNNPLKRILINNHSWRLIKVKLKDNYPYNTYLDFVKLSKKYQKSWISAKI